MSKTNRADGSQELFETCYRGRQSFLHHMSYVRMSKVQAALRIMDRNAIDLRDASFFDYGFGAGTFFRFLPQTCQMAGVEQDPVIVNEVAGMLRERGCRNVDLQPIEIQRWRDHPLLQRTYDLILCSHVLEHVPEPVDFLNVLKKSLSARGRLLIVVPINEIRDNVHHVSKIDRDSIDSWTAAAGLKLVDYQESDPWGYWQQPLYANDSTNRILTQGMGLGFGIPASLLGAATWESLGQIFAGLLNWKNTQAAFIAIADEKS
jgi:2-polyprenyl-3-methyl-5-hydroxy-6-metoxy-1,4-benzoquinol methylase